jgi:hypothetical protein
MKKAMINYMKQPKNDELYTPEYAITPLLKYLSMYQCRHEVKRKPIIWECTDYGNSNITKVLKENGYKVISTHKNNFNFLTDITDFEFDMIITNPPYSLKDEFIQKCYEYNKPFCLLLPLTSLEGINRGKMFRKYGIDVLLFDKRIDFLEGNSCYFNTSWFCYNFLPKQLIFEELNKSNWSDLD